MENGCFSFSALNLSVKLS